MGINIFCNHVKNQESASMKRIFIILFILTLLAVVAFFVIQRQTKISTKEKKETNKLVFNNSSYDFELRRTLGYSVSSGADINECLDTANRIIEGNDESWYTEWMATADRIYGIAKNSLAFGHIVSAREAFLRASNYFRVAEFYLHGNPKDPRILDSWRKSRDSFREAAKLLDTPVEVIQIPYEDTYLPGYILRADESFIPRKTLIVQTGFDGTGEELYFEVAFFALKRGYNVLIFEGPGQGGALREQHLYFRYDWEKVVTPVVDFALSRQEFDPKRIALMGISMGGYLAPRAAAFEHRLAALIVNPGVYDMTAGHSTKEEIQKNPEGVNKRLREQMEKDPGFRWSINNGMFTFGKNTPAEFLTAEFDYNLKEVAPLIESPTLVIDSQDEQFFPGQAKQLFDNLTSPKTLMHFTDTDMASSHCQAGAVSLSNQRILDWLDELFSKLEN